MSVSHLPVSEKLEKLGVEFTMREVDYLFNHDAVRYSILQSPVLTLDEAQITMDIAKFKIKSETRKAILEEHFFLFDNPLTCGGIKTSLYYVYSQSGGVLAAKVYNGNMETFMREVEANQAFEHENVVKFMKTFSIQGPRHVIIMPFYPRSVADWLDHHPEIPLLAIRRIARNCFDALCHIHSKGFCFMDLKPSNIMLQNNEPCVARLVDFGATVRTGSPTIEFTEAYCMDAYSVTSSEFIDWICLGTTLAHMGGFDIHEYRWIGDLIYDVTSSTKDDYLKNLILSCLKRPSSSSIEAALSG